MSRTTYLKILNYYNQSCSRKYKLLFHPFASNFSLTTNTLRRFWGCRDPAADRNLVLTFYFGLALPTLSTVLTVHTQTANRGVFGVLKSHNRTLSAWIVVKTSGVLSPRLTMHSEPLTFKDLHKFVIYLNSNKITLQLNTKFVKFNSLTSELLVFNLNDSFQCTSNVHEHSVFCGVVFLHPYFMSIAYR